MTTITILLDGLVLTPGSTTGPSSTSHDELVQFFRDSYSFLGPEASTTVEEGARQITLPDPSGYQRDQAFRNYERAVRLGERARYGRVTRLLQEVVSVLPAHADARRNLAMAYLESGSRRRVSVRRSL